MVSAVIRYLLLFNILVSAALANEGDVFNGEFEVADLNRRTLFSPTPPADWYFRDVLTDERGLYVNKNAIQLKENFYKPQPGENILWLSGPQNGRFFVLLGTGPTYDDRDQYHSTLSQLVVLNPGDVVCGYYFFGTCDYKPFVDTAFAKLIDPHFNFTIEPSLSLETYEDGSFKNPDLIPPTDLIHPSNGIELFRISVSDVGDFRATEGWQRFYYRYSGTQTKTFQLIFQVRDALDKYLSSYLALDNIRICRNVPAIGDINQDCHVDMLDLVTVASNWLVQCALQTDPNTGQISENCLQSDLNGDGLVDAADLTVLAENWLSGDNCGCATEEFDSADVNFDCKVDFDDYLFFAKSWLADCQIVGDPGKTPYNPYCMLADINKDNRVNVQDALLYAEQWLIHNDPSDGENQPPE